MCQGKNERESGIGRMPNASRVRTVALFVLAVAPTALVLRGQAIAGRTPAATLAVDTAAISRTIKKAGRLIMSQPDSAIGVLDAQWSRISNDARRLVGLRYFLARAEGRFNLVDATACMQECDSAMRYSRPRHLEDLAAIDYLRGRAFALVGDYTIAYKLIDGARSTFSKARMIKSVAECNNELGWIHYIQEQYSLAERRWRAMLSEAREIDDLRLEAVALRRVGLACLYLYDPDDLGQAYYDSALAVSRALGDPYELAGIHGNIGRHMDSALFYAKASGDDARLHSIMHTAGNVALNNGDFAPAMKYCLQALEFAQRVGNPMLERDAASCMCDAYRLAGRWKDAFMMMQVWRGINDRIVSSRSRDEIVMRALGRDFEARMREDSLVHAAELERAASERRIEQLRADRNQNRVLAIGVGGLLLLAAGGLVFRIDRKRRRERFERDSARLQMQVLRTQMNPHFIFNALNSINNYVQENERDLASGFLTKFARLMRLVLENSRHSEVPLAQDLETLRLYMELERARMNGKFDFSIEVDRGIDQETTLVPPLVMQPFVENAIWHGISRQEDKGHIRLTVSEEGKRLMMTVEDDGVGRQPSAGPTSPDGSSPKTSLGTAITRDRLALLGKQRDGEAGFRYVDVPLGTRVEVTIPNT